MDKHLLFEDQIPAYLENELSTFERQAFDTAMENSSELKSLVNEYRELSIDLSTWPSHDPEPALQTDFDMFLNDKIKNQESVRPNKSPNSRLLLSVLVISFVGFIAYMLYDNHQTNQALKQQMFAMNENVRNLLQNESSSHRIKALRISAEMPKVNSDLLEILTHALKSDPSSNVRLSALETLEKHLNNDIVRTEIYRSMGKEKDPIVLMTYINILKNRNDASSIDQLRKITENDSNELFVKDQAMMSLFQLQEY